MNGKSQARARRTRQDEREPGPGVAKREDGARPQVVDGAVGGARAVDRVIHQPVRLSIVSVLAVNDGLTFNEIKSILEVSDGNLSVHARKLEDAGYVSCDKSFVGRVPRTTYRLTRSGKAALERYLSHMQALIESVRES